MGISHIPNQIVMRIPLSANAACAYLHQCLCKQVGRGLMYPDRISEMNGRVRRVAQP